LSACAEFLADIRVEYAGAADTAAAVEGKREKKTRKEGKKMDFFHLDRFNTYKFTWLSFAARIPEPTTRKELGEERGKKKKMEKKKKRGKKAES